MTLTPTTTVGLLTKSRRKFFNEHRKAVKSIHQSIHTNVFGTCTNVCVSVSLNKPPPTIADWQALYRHSNSPDSSSFSTFSCKVGQLLLLLLLLLLFLMPLVLDSHRLRNYLKKTIKLLVRLG